MCTSANPPCVSSCTGLPSPVAGCQTVSRLDDFIKEKQWLLLVLLFPVLAVGSGTTKSCKWSEEKKGNKPRSYNDDRLETLWAAPMLVVRYGVRYRNPLSTSNGCVLFQSSSVIDHNGSLNTELWWKRTTESGDIFSPILLSLNDSV